MGLTAGLGGGFLILGQVGSFEVSSIGGRGFIAISAVIFGGWTLIGTIAGSFLFGLADAFRLALPSLGYEFNSQLMAALPYVLTLVVMLFFAKRVREPGALAQPFYRGLRLKACFYGEHGGPDVLQYADVADPEPAPADVVVEEQATAINHLDMLQRNGYFTMPGFAMPHIAGMDVSRCRRVGGERSRWRRGRRPGGLSTPGYVRGARRLEAVRPRRPLRRARHHRCHG